MYRYIDNAKTTKIKETDCLTNAENIFKNKFPDRTIVESFFSTKLQRNMSHIYYSKPWVMGNFNNENILILYIQADNKMKEDEYKYNVNNEETSFCENILPQTYEEYETYYRDSTMINLRQQRTPSETRLGGKMRRQMRRQTRRKCKKSSKKRKTMRRH